AGTAGVSLKARPRRARPATTPMRRRVDPLSLVAKPGVLPTEQPQPSRSELARVLSRSLRSNSSAMMQAFFARQHIRVHGYNRRPWSSLYMDRRT
ncbi:unnamed protein product, partial [Ectocarpus sp. 12 AP-2014]